MISINGHNVPSLTFPGGEEHIRLPKDLKVATRFNVIARLQASEDILQLLLVIDALRNMFGDPIIHLHIPYLPYARQDRVTCSGEALSIRVMCQLLDNLRVYHIHLYDVHSDAINLFLTKTKFSVRQLYSMSNKYVGSIPDDAILVAPDMGARGKVKRVARSWGLDMAQGLKVREPETGNLAGFDVTDEVDVNGKKCYILDDICDGGGTFLGLAQKLRDLGAVEVHLFVTHGLFSKGVKLLLDNGIDTVATTNTWINSETKGLKIFKEV